MTKRRAFLQNTILSLVASQCLLTASASAESARPNIIFYLMDDISTLEFGAYGSKANLTPNIDRLAATGIRFNSAWACPMCVPTRALVLSGQYGFKTGITENKDGVRVESELPEEIMPLARALKQGGYATFMAGKWHQSGLPGDKAWGFDHYYLYGSLCDAAKSNKEWVARFKGPWWGQKYGGTPPGFPSAQWHPMIIRDGEFVETSPKDFGPDLMCDEVLGYIRKRAAAAPPFFIYYGEFLPHAPHDPMPDPASPTGKTPEGMDHGVRYIDKVVKRLVDGLRAAGVWENTVLFICGDNPTDVKGKTIPAPIGARVPMFVVGGKQWVTWNGETGCLMDFADFYPTFLELAGLDVKSHPGLDGRSFKPLLDGKRDQTRPWIFSYLGNNRTIRNREWSIDGFGQLWRCHASGDPFRFELIAAEQETPEARKGRAELEAILAGMPGYVKRSPEDPRLAEGLQKAQRMYERHQGGDQRGR